MKKTILLILVICSVVSSYSYGWNEVFHSSGGNSFQAVYFPTANTGYAVGLQGLICKTTDGGITWNQQNSGTTQALRDVFFINNNIGYAVGGNPTNTVVIKTIDGGATWTTQVNPVNNVLYSVYFTDINIGYAAGRFGTIIKTTDGGSNWQVLTSGVANHLNSIYFTDDTTGFVVGTSLTILKTTDAGSTWNLQLTGTPTQLNSVFFPETNIGYACGSDTLIKTTDGGISWFGIPANMNFSPWEKLFFTDAITGYAVYGGIYKTTDGGLTWIEQAKDIHYNMSDVFFINDSVGFAVGGNEILKTDIGGGYKGYNFMSASNINARFNTNGNLFFDFIGNSFFEVPKGTGKTTMLCGALLIAGKDNNNQLHVVGNRFNSFGDDLFPGPIMDSIYNKHNQEKWNRMWKISRNDVENHVLHWENSGYQIPESILEWPGNGDTSKGMMHTIAPYYDFNGDGNYTPQQGDYPLMKGDEAMFFVLNDSLFTHTETGGKKLGVEIHAMTYAFNCPEDSALWNTLFLNYEIINRSQNTYDSAFVGTFMEPDIGDASDDHMDCDVQRGSIYAYNGDSNDGDGSGNSYGTNPPAQSITFLGGPIMDADGSDYGSTGIPNGCDESINGLNFNDGIIDNERLGMTRFMRTYPASGATGFPCTPEQYYGYLKSYWMDGLPLTYGGTGHYSSAIQANFTFPGQPTSDTCGWGTNGVPQTDWSEGSLNYPPSDSRGIASMGPFTMLPGSVHNVDIAFVFGRDYVNPDNRASVAVMQQRIDSVRKAFITQKTPCGNFGIGIKENKIKEQITLFPNPANSYFDVKTESNSTNNFLKIYSIEGTLVKESSFTGNQTRIFTDKLSNGLYVVEIRSDNNVQYKKVIVTK